MNIKNLGQFLRTEIKLALLARANERDESAEFKVQDFLHVLSQVPDEAIPGVYAKQINGKITSKVAKQLAREAGDFEGWRRSLHNYQKDAE